ncbi:MAG TPA: tetratricopeptide repeat protein, partial [Spirochaetota bacterium]|nr:tetratricopeptide repeat protein [Spirochaetota bacterium]
MKKFIPLLLIIVSILLPLEAQAGSAAEKRLYMMGKKAFDDKGYNFAILKFTSLIEDYPESEYLPEAYYYSALASFYIKDYDKALQYFNQLADNFPVSPYTGRSRYHICNIFVQKQQYSAAIEEARTTLKKYPDNEYKGKIQILIGDIYLKLGNSDRALEAYRQVQGDFLDEALFKIALVYYRAGNYKTAEKYFLEVIRKMPEKNAADQLEKVLYYRAKTAFFKKDYQRAVKEFRSFVLKYPQSSYNDEIRFYLGYTPFELSNYQQCIDNLEDYLQQYPESTYRDAALFYTARSLEFIDQNILALSEYKKIIKNHQDSTYYSISLRRMYHLHNEEGNEDSALKLLEQLKSSSNVSNQEFALKEFAFYYLDKDAAKSEKYFMQLIKKFSQSKDSFKYYKWYSSILLEKDKTRQAVAVLKKAYERYPASADKLTVLRLIADNLITIDKYEEARSYYARIIKEYPEDQARFYGIEGVAYTYYLAKKYARALQHYKDLKRADSVAMKAKAYFYTAEIQRLTGDKQKAVFAFKTFIRNFPNDQRVTDAYLRIARIYYSRKRYDKAYDEYQELFRKFENNLHVRTKAMYYMARSKYHQNDIEAAYKHFYKLKEIDPELSSDYSVKGLLICGKILYNKQKYKKAIDAYITLINKIHSLKKKQHSIEAYYELSMCFLQLGDIEQTVFYLDKLYSKYPEAVELYSDGLRYIAEYYVEKRQYHQAAQKYLKAAEYTEKKDK